MPKSVGHSQCNMPRIFCRRRRIRFQESRNPAHQTLLTGTGGPTPPDEDGERTGTFGNSACPPNRDLQPPARAFTILRRARGKHTNMTAIGASITRSLVRIPKLLIAALKTTTNCKLNARIKIINGLRQFWTAYQRFRRRRQKRTARARPFQRCKSRDSAV